MNLKTVEKYESWGDGDHEYPGGFSVAGKGTEKEDDQTFPYCSYIQASKQGHFSWCANNGKCEFNRFVRDNRAVCRAWCSDVLSDRQCKAGEKVSRKKSGSTTAECCVKDEDAINLKTSVVLSEAFFKKCVDNQNDYAKYKDCAKGFSSPSRLYADDIPQLQTPTSTVMPVFAASAAAFAACAAIVVYRRRSQP